MEVAIVGQEIREEENGAVSIFNLLLDNFNVGFKLAIIFLFSFLVVLATSVLLDENELTSRVRFGGTAIRREAPKLTQRIASAVSNFGSSRLSAIGLFVLFVHLFLWQTQLFLTNNIKVPERQTGLFLKLEVIWF